MDHFGIRLRMLREDMGLTQQQVVAGSGILDPNYRGLESGKTENPTAGTYAKLASGFGLSVEEFKSRLAAINVTRPTSLEERDRLHRIIQAVERVHWTEDREDGISGLLDRWKRTKGVR